MHTSLALPRAWLLAALPLLVSMFTAGCTVHKAEDSKGTKNVSLQTPWGGLKVRTQADASETGLALYPGARRVADEDARQHSANISISLPVVKVKVVAVKFETDDPPEKVLEFYRRELEKHGSWSECHGGFEFNKDEIHCRERKQTEDETQLVTGTEERHRIVAVKRMLGHTEFALVYVHTREGEESM